MGELRMKKAGDGIGSRTDFQANTALTHIDHPNGDDLRSAEVMAILDLINELRVLGLIGLAAKTPEQFKSMVETKLVG